MAASILAIIFFCGYMIGYSNVNKDMHQRVTEAEMTTKNCLNKMAGWCDNKRFRLVDCGNDLQICICMSQNDVEDLKKNSKEN